MLNLFGFLICGMIIFFAGKKLSTYGDRLGVLTGLGQAWIGLILMSAVTSLPELMVGISSSSFIQSADLAVGDILGSCALNLAILSVMDVFTPKDKPLFNNISQNNVLAAALGIILICMVGLGLFLNADIIILPSVGLTSLGFGIIYFVAIRTLYSYQKTHPNQILEQIEELNKPSLKETILYYSLFAFIIIVAALVLPYFAEELTNQTGLGKSFVGTLFLAFSTSLPELAVSIAAARMGKTDLAVGNLLGSNIFNVFILFLDDVFYTKGHLLKDASDINMLSVFFVLLMSATVIIGFIFPQKVKRIFMSWDTMIILGLYITNIILLYELG